MQRRRRDQELPAKTLVHGYILPMNAKLDTARVFERIFSVYGEPVHAAGPGRAACVFLPVALLNALVLTGGGVLAALITAAVAIIATYWYQGMVVEATVDILDGRRDHTIGSLFSSAAPFIAPLFLAGLLAGIGIAIGLVLLIVPGLILLTIWSVIVPVIVIERTGVLDAFGRSRELVRDNGWRVFGVIVVLFLRGGASSAASCDGIIGGLTDESFVGYALADLIVNVLLAPLTAIAATVVYVELRRVKGEPLAEDAGAQAPAPLPPQEPAPAGTQTQAPPAEPQDAPPQTNGPEAPPR